MMKEGNPMPEEQTPALPSGDIPNSWGFHLLQELRHLEDKIDTRFTAQDAKIVALDAKMDARFVAQHAEIASLEEKMDARFVAMEEKIDARFAVMQEKMDARFIAMQEKIDARFVAMEKKLDTRFVAQDARLDAAVVSLRQEISGLRYWAWGSIVAVFIGTVTIILTLQP